MRKNYTFQPDGKSMKQDFILQDEEKNTVYEAKVLKQPLFGPSTVEFTNHVSGRTEQHSIGKTVNIGEGNDVETYIAKSYFKFDGQKIWDYLHDRGIFIETSQTEGRLGLVYNVTKNGRDIAVMETAAMSGILSFMSSGMNLNISAEEDELDNVFLTAFAVAKTERAE